MIRNVSKEDIGKLSELFGKQFNEDEIDYELSMLDDVDGDFFSVFLVGALRVPEKLEDYDDEVFWHEVLGIHTKDFNDKSLEHVFYESKAATHKLIMYWLPWTEENAKMVQPGFIEETYNGVRFLCYMVMSRLDSKYKG